MDWMLLPYRRYADFTGRSRRKEYWLFTLFYWGVIALLCVVMFAGLPWSEMALEHSGGSASPPGPLFWGGLALLMLFILGSLVPSIAVTVRRFHDQDMSGWLYLLNFIPYIGGIVVFVFMCIDGKRGENRYGSDPKDPHLTEVFA